MRQQTNRNFGGIWIMRKDGGHAVIFHVAIGYDNLNLVRNEVWRITEKQSFK